MILILMVQGKSCLSRAPFPVCLLRCLHSLQHARQWRNTASSKLYLYRACPRRQMQQDSHQLMNRSSKTYRASAGAMLFFFCFPFCPFTSFKSQCVSAGVQGAARTPTSAQRQVRKPPDTEPAWGMRARRTTGVSAAGQLPLPMSPALSPCTGRCLQIAAIHACVTCSVTCSL